MMKITMLTLPTDLPLRSEGESGPNALLCLTRGLSGGGIWRYP